jgi:hypothetical protein
MSEFIVFLSSVFGAAVSSSIMGFVVLYPDKIRYKIREFNLWRWECTLLNKQFLYKKECNDSRWSISPYSSGKRIGKLLREIANLQLKIDNNKSITASDGTKTIFHKVRKVNYE